MIFRSFQRPDFICAVKIKKNGEDSIRMLNAGSEAEARACLQQKGYTVHSVAAFDNWQARATAETERVKKAYADGTEKDYEFKSKLWGELKEYLLDLFEGKCAYCEASFRHVAWGDIEHYRPKKAPSRRRNTSKQHGSLYDRIRSFFGSRAGMDFT